ncbi:MAG: polysaccharide deacetylase family protein [Gemmataceae bacterium]
MTLPPPRFARTPIRPRRAGRGVRLTFDDGPHPAHTPAVLDRMDRFDVRATFFVLGNRVPAAAEVVRRIHSTGHAVGNHTFTHPRPRWFGFAEAFEELSGCQRAVNAVTGVEPTLFRPPLGRWTLPLWWACRQLGLTPMGWSLDSGDWRVRSDADAEQCAAEVLAAVRPGDVILLHDYHPWIAPILDVLLPDLAARGLLQPGRVSSA